MSRSALLHLASRTASRAGLRRALLSSMPGSYDSNYSSPLADFFQMVSRNETSFGVTEYVLSQPPSAVLACGVSEDALEFSTSCYGRLQLAPHVQPLENRVVLKVSLDDLPIKTLVEKVLLKEIVGKRFSEEKNTLQLQSNLFGSRIENKRHLVSMLDRIILGTKRLAKEMEEEEEQELSKKA